MERDRHQPPAGPLDEAQFERLVSGLSMVIGWEAVVVLQDLRGLPPDEKQAVSLWAARALIRAALETTAPPTAAARRGGRRGAR